MDQGKPSVEKGKLTPESQDVQSSISVRQPDKMGDLLETINLLAQVSERLGEDRSGDMSTGGSQQQDGSGQTQISLRDQAIKNIPTEPVLRKQLTQHIEKEVRVLRKEARRAARKVSKPGTAHTLNELYARIRRLNSLLASLFEASYDVVKRLFIRVFVDKQSIASN